MSGNDFEGFGRPNWQKPENGDEHGSESGDVSQEAGAGEVAQPAPSEATESPSGHEGLGAHFGGQSEVSGQPEAATPSAGGYEAPSAPTRSQAPAADVQPTEQTAPDQNNTEVLGFGDANQTAVLGRGDENQTEILDQGAPPAPTWNQASAPEQPAHPEQPNQAEQPGAWNQPSAQEPAAWNAQDSAAPAPAAWDQQPSAPAWGQPSPNAQDAPTTQNPAWNAQDAGQGAPAQGAGGFEAPGYGAAASAPNYGNTNEAPTYGSTAPEAAAPAYGAAAYGAQQQAGAWNGSPEGAQQTPAPYGAAPVPGQAVGAPGYGGDGGGGYQGGGPSGPNGFGNGAPAKKPWFRKPAILIPAIVGVVAIIGASIAIPVTIHNNNVNRGDELAAAFQTDLDAHYADWTDENLDLASNVTISASLGENTDFFAQSSAQMDDFSTRCGNVATAETTINDLAGSTVPALPVEDGADASEAYKAAITESDGLGDRRDIVANFAETASTDVAALQQFCEAFPKYNSVYNTFGTELAAMSSNVFTIPNGQDIDLGNNLYITCTATSGCPDYSDPAIGSKIADAFQSTYVNFYRGIADLAASECFLDELADVCASYNTEFGKAADAAQKAADAYRAETVTRAAGQPPFPNSTPVFNAMFDTFDAADSAVQAAWWTADPTVDGQSDRGWQSRSLKTLLSKHESSIATLVESVR